MKRTATLPVLDEYAKTISVKQTKMLLEAKKQKKYSNALFESEDDEYSDNMDMTYTLFIDEDTCEKNDYSMDELYLDLPDWESRGVTVEQKEDGIKIEADNHVAYGDVIQYLIDELEFDVDDIEALTDPNY